MNGTNLDIGNHIKLCEALNIAPDGSDRVLIIPKNGMIGEIFNVIENDKTLSRNAQTALLHIFAESYTAMERFQNRTA